jgi:DNA-damage-inducible protein D
MLGPGERARDIAARKGLAHGQAILDYMNSEELAANLFRVTQTAARIRREGIQGKSAANQTHHDVGRKVRQTIQELGGTMPEDLPTPTESIKRVERRTQRALQPRQQPTLLPAEPPDA